MNSIAQVKKTVSIVRIGRTWHWHKDWSGCSSTEAFSSWRQAFSAALIIAGCHGATMNDREWRRAEDLQEEVDRAQGRFDLWSWEPKR
jgi:hypothetical protein